MEEPLIIKRDEIIFKIGFYICLIALLCLIVSFAVISYNQWWHGSVYDESLIAEIFLWIFSFSIGGVPLSLSISCHIGPGALAVTVTKKTEY